MRLYEIECRYFLCTDYHLKAGKVFSCPGVTHPLGAVLEAALDQRRPEGALSREWSFYLSTESCESAEYVYAVEPIGQIDRQHCGWLSMLKRANAHSEGEVDQYSRGYWSGTLYPEGRDEPWELRCLKVKVLKRAGGWGLTRQGHVWTA